MLDMAWSFIKDVFEINRKKYKEPCEQNRRNAKKRVEKYERSQAVAADTDTDTETDTDTDTETDIDTDTDIDIVTEKETAEDTDCTSAESLLLSIKKLVY